MTTFKVGDRVRSLDRGFSVCGQVGTITSLPHNKPGYMVTFEPDLSGPLFHHPHEVEAENISFSASSDTETLRDRFAIAGFQAALASASGLGETDEEGRAVLWKQVAKIVYEGADAMMAERERAK